jgi:hypothetical protein
MTDSYKAKSIGGDMPQEAYGTTQVRELRFTRREVEALVMENLHARLSQSYDFDYDRPIILHEGEDVIVRFVQRDVTREARPKSVRMAPIDATLTLPSSHNNGRARLGGK